MARLQQHRDILEGALRPSRQQAMPAQPIDPRPRALQAPVLEPSTQPQAQVTCDEAAGTIADFGFSDVRMQECSGELYRFSATRDGTAYSIGITATSGEIADVSRQ